MYGSTTVQIITAVPSEPPLWNSVFAIFPATYNMSTVYPDSASVLYCIPCVCVYTVVIRKYDRSTFTVYTYATVHDVNCIRWALIYVLICIFSRHRYACGNSPSNFMFVHFRSSCFEKKYVRAGAGALHYTRRRYFSHAVYRNATICV